MVFSNKTVVTLIHSSINVIGRNTVHNAFHSNLLFQSCGNNLLIVRDPSGILVWSICVKDMFMLHDIRVCTGRHEIICMVPCSLFYY